MKFEIEKTDLLRVLDRARGIVERRNTIPILSNIMITAATGPLLTVVATDLDVEVTLTTDKVSVLEAGATTVPAHLVHEIARKLPDGAMISFEVSKDGVATVKAGRSRFSLATLPKEDFPAFAESKLSTTFTIPAQTLAGMISKLRMSMSSEETRYYLCGFYLHAHGDRLRGVSTDGHRLTRVETDLPDGAAGMKGIIVPRRAAVEIHKLIAEMEGDVEFSASDTKFRISASDIVIRSKVIDGNFPPYERVIPQGNSNILEIDDVRELAAVLDRVGVIFTDRTHAAKFSLYQGGITVSGRASGTSSDSSEDLGCDYNGTPMEIGFNLRYFSEMLSQVQTNGLRLLFGDPGTPMLAEPIGDTGSIYLLMPMRV